jgi:hypothetical protein
MPVSVKDMVTKQDLEQWSYLRNVPYPAIDCPEVGLLIGSNAPALMEPWDIVPSQREGPFAVRTALGWVINGPLDVHMSGNLNKAVRFVSVNCVKTDIECNEVSLDEHLKNQFNHDFNERVVDDVQEWSREDKEFMKPVDASCVLKDGQYVISLPFRNKDFVFQITSHKLNKE